MSVYNPNIPQSTDLISSSQSQMLANFGQLNTQFAVDHSAFESGGNNGTGHHTKMTIDSPISDPGASGSVGVYYTKSISSVTSPYFQNAAQAASLWFGGSGNGLASATLSNQGALNLPNGFQLRWGNATTSGANAQVSISPAFSTNCFAVVLTPNAATASTISVNIDSTTPRTASNFYVNSSAAIEYFWIAIGN